MLPNDIAPCSGAKTSAPEAVLCRNCARTQPGGEYTPFIEPAVRTLLSWNRPHCPNVRSNEVSVRAS